VAEDGVAVVAAGVQLAWHLAPSAAYTSSTHMSHVVSYDMNGTLKALMGSRADDVTILEDRAVSTTTGSTGAVDEEIADQRRYGGTDPKDTSVQKRTASYKGAIAPDGECTPSDEPLVDAGAGALAQLPSGPIQTGATWTFTRRILVERDLGSGTMTYTDTLTRVDTRGGHQIAVVDVKGAGRVDLTSDLQAKGFHTTDMALEGTGEFDVTAGLPGVGHYTAHAEWTTRLLGVKVGIIFDDTYDATPWVAGKSP